MKNPREAVVYLGEAEEQDTKKKKHTHCHGYEAVEMKAAKLAS